MVLLQYLEENVGALGIELTPEVKAELEDIFHPDLVRLSDYSPPPQFHHGLSENIYKKTYIHI